MLLCSCIFFYTTMSECMIFYGPTVPEINYSIIFYSMYRQNICQATYVLYSCDMCVISYMCGTMAYSIDVSARWSN